MSSFDNSLLRAHITILQQPCTSQQDSLTDFDDPSAKRQYTGVTEEPNDLEIRSVTPSLPKEKIKRKSSTTKKYSWKKENPEGEEFIAEKCAAVQKMERIHIL